jgi:uncharacterized protein (DUF983 family)
MTTRVFGGADAHRPWLTALLRGAAKRCPSCGMRGLFAGYTRVAPACARCGLEFTGHRADDAPPYVTTLIVGHLTIPAALAVTRIFEPPLAWQFAIFLPLIVAMTLWLLPISKGALIGVQWANRMHGFGDGAEDEPARP